ncbi:hypothetical protein ACFXMT_15195 [Streptomyces mirabilis]|uniref:hypothetical protein n=1 Tax=Streptomyces mirabilis TaxID=68239 RepID=UPI00368D21BA
MAGSYDFPQDLTDAQDELRQVRADLQTVYRRVPWSAEPLEAWETHENAWRPSSRPASPRLGSPGRGGGRPATRAGSRARHGDRHAASGEEPTT